MVDGLDLARPERLPQSTDRYITFEITEDDIARGARPPYQYTHYYCPFARAIQRAIGHGVAVGYGYAQIYWAEGQKGTWYKHKYTSLLREWDRTAKLSPMKGVLERE